MTTRCKFVCNEVTKRYDAWKKVYVYEAKFSAVYDNSPENKAFFDATPTGSLSIGVYKADVLFEPGKEYYLDVTLVEPVAA